MTATQTPPTSEAFVSWSDHARLWAARREGLVIFLLVFVGLVIGIAAYHTPVIQVSDEAVVRSGVAADLLAGRLAGRQGLIGSLDWAPLPTLLGLLFVRIPWLGASGLAYAVLAAGMSAFTVLLLNRWCRLFGLHRMVRYPVLIAWQMSPPVWGAVLAGSSTVMLVALFVAGLYFLMHWLTTLELRSLGYLGALSALAVVTDWRTLAVALLVLIFVVVRLLLKRVGARFAPALPERSFSGATLLVLLVPVLYAALVWAASNWLIMGNPFFFLRGLLHGASLVSPGWYNSLGWHLYVPPLLILVFGRAYAASSDRWGRSFRIATGLLLAGIIAAVAAPYLIELQTGRSYLQAYQQKVRTVDEMISDIEHRYPEARVVVCGYYGYELAQRASVPDLFVHVLTLSLSEVDRRTHGKELFLLLPRPTQGRDWEDIYLNHPNLFKDYEDYRLQDRFFRAAFIYEDRWPGPRPEDRPAQVPQPEWLLLRMILQPAPPAVSDT